MTDAGSLIVGKTNAADWARLMDSEVQPQPALTQSE